MKKLQGRIKSNKINQLKMPTIKIRKAKRKTKRKTRIRISRVAAMK